MKKAPHHLRRKGMPIDKLLEGAVGKFEIETYSGGRDLSSDYVPFTGALKKHPYDETKVVLIIDPYSTRLSYCEFNKADIGAADELPSLATMAGESVRMARIWVKKGVVAIQSLPFVVADTADKL